MHAVFGASEFKSLMPSDMENPPLGVPYHVLPYGPASDGHQAYSATAHSSSRYYPPMPKDKEGVLFRLLGMMHHHPFLNMRFPPRGTVASVQAFNDKYIHVVFRWALPAPPLVPTFLSSSHTQCWILIWFTHLVSSLLTLIYSLSIWFHHLGSSSLI